MAITDGQRRAICRVYVPGADRWGTGFLVAADRVMTAAHVVGRKDDERGPYEAPDIALYFGNPAERIKVTEGTVAPEDFHAEHDWALISIPEGSAKVAPFQLRPLSPGYAVPWETFGYPQDDAVLGTAYKGTVLTLNPRRMQLSSLLANDVPHGLSGAPCIVDGDAVGLIVRAKHGSSSETFYAVCMSTIAHPSVEQSEAPYVDDAAQLLGARLNELDVYLNYAAAVFGLPDAPTIARCRKPNVVANAMMKAGMRMELGPIEDAISHLVNGLEVEDAVRIAGFATRAWIDTDAVSRLRKVLMDSPSIAIVNTTEADIGRWYVHRAGCAGQLDPGRFRKCQLVSVVSPGDQREMRAGVEKALEAMSKRRPFDLTTFLSAHPHTRSPLVLIVPCVPPRAVLDKVRSEMPCLDQVRFVLLSGSALTPAAEAEYSDATIIKPMLEQSVADRALFQHKTTLNNVRELYHFPRLEDT